MLRVALILAVLAAIGSLVVSFVFTEPTVKDLRTNLATTTQNLQETQTALDKTKSDLKKTSSDLEARSKELDTTKTQLEEATVAASNNKKRADQLDSNLAKTTKERNEAQAELAQWQALGVKPDQVIQIRADLKKTAEAKVALEDEKAIFLKRIGRLENRLAKYEAPDEKVKMPDGLKGSVLAVGPLQDFVLLDIGENQGVKERGEFLIRRGNKLIGKAAVVSVEANRAIANILPAWKQGDVRVAENDQVLY